MLAPRLNSLRFQIAAAFFGLVAAFSGASLYALAAFQRQIDYDTVVDIAARLELTAQQMHMQAVNYKQNAPRDYPTYYRDLNLYYQDLMAQIELFDRVVAGFMDGDLSRIGPVAESAASGGDDPAAAAEAEMPMPRAAPWLDTDAETATSTAIAALEARWLEYRSGLMAAIGDDHDEPRLEWAAEHVLAQHMPLQAASHDLTQSLRESASAAHRRVGTAAFALIGGSLLTALLILGLLHFRALRPLSRTIAGFERVAAGDFGQMTPEQGATEIRALTTSFNALSARLNLLFLLIDRLQRGNDLDEVVGFLARELPGLLRFDWIGVVLVNPDQATVRLEASALDGVPEREQPQLFGLRGTLLERALGAGRPMHIADMAQTAANNPSYQFLRDLCRRGLNDAIFLPVAAATPTPAVVAFATRAPGRYDAAHMQFLTNIAQLVSESFGRTVRLSERGRLAVIGELASGIAHELRTPLATVGLALDYAARQTPAVGVQKRLDLARAEARRMGRLLEDILLYAKPLALSLRPVDLTVLAEETLAAVGEQAPCAGQRLTITADGGLPRVNADPDRLAQVLTNLLRNACEGAPPGTTVALRVRHQGADEVSVSVHNPGAAIPPALLERIFEPFVTAKQGGTGLGLAIAKRLVEAHGGQITIDSDASGTVSRLRLPAPTQRSPTGGPGSPAAGTLGIPAEAAGISPSEQH